VKSVGPRSWSEVLRTGPRWRAGNLEFANVVGEGNQIFDRGATNPDAAAGLVVDEHALVIRPARLDRNDLKRSGLSGQTEGKQG
jgi:hypothetical protein